MNQIKKYWTSFKRLSGKIKPFDDVKLEKAYQAYLRDQYYEQIKIALIIGGA